MRNPFEISQKLRHLVKNPSIWQSGHVPSRNFAALPEKSSKKRRAKSHCHDGKESTLEAVEAITASKSRSVSKGNTLYLLDDTAAKKFATLVAANRSSNSPHVAEINSGLGLLTKELLDAGIPSIQMFEGIGDFLPNLAKLADRYPDRLCLETVDFYHLWNLGYVDWKEKSSKLDYYLTRVERKTWKDEPAIEIIGALANINFIQRLVATVTFGNTLTKYGRMALYVAIPPSVWAHLNCTNERYDIYRTRIIMFQILFRCELLGNLPRSVFYPNNRPAKKRLNRRRKLCEDDGTIMHVVKIEAKSDIFKDDFTEDDIIPFYYFVNYHLRSRKNKIIPALENWIPGCGRILIAQGYNIFTEFGELLPHEILKLFKEFRSWPDYKKSTFISCMDTFLTNVDEQIVFAKNSENMDEIFESSMSEHENPEAKSMD